MLQENTENTMNVFIEICIFIRTNTFTLTSGYNKIYYQVVIIHMVNLTLYQCYRVLEESSFLEI